MMAKRRTRHNVHRFFQYSVTQIERMLHEQSPPPPFPPASDRAAWERVRQVLAAEDTARIFREAEEALQTPPRPLPATLYLEVKRTGEREAYQDAANKREARLTSLVFAECLEYQRRFLDAILDHTWAICEESSWAWPAHQIELADVENPVIDLISSAKGWMLAELDLLLGDVLEPKLRKRIRDEVDKRLFQPYLRRDDFSWLYNAPPFSKASNWTAVCNAGVIAAALYLETDTKRLARMIAKALRSLEDYLESFDRDGGSSEGPGYWAYGFGNFVLLAHLLEHRTGGQLRLLDGERIHRIATFPLRTRLSHNAYANFSDSGSHLQIPVHLLTYLAQRLQPALLGLITDQPVNDERYMWLTPALREIFWQPDGSALSQNAPVAKRDWFSEMMWLISRAEPENADGLILAVKGGHNDELHNQNDVGSFIVHWMGESLIAELGAGRYTRDYFNDRRYIYFAAQSLSHSCPVPNGQQQMAGRPHAAELLHLEADDFADSITFELKGAYPLEADLVRLQRTLTLYRDVVQIELLDAFEYRTVSHEFESVLITLAQVKIGDGHVDLIGEKGKLLITYDADLVYPRLEVIPQVDLAAGMTDVRRLIFAFKTPAQVGDVRLSITPVS
jgi:hypothetical protein